VQLAFARVADVQLAFACVADMQLAFADAQPAFLLCT
jgi:hypothetical protein